MSWQIDIARDARKELAGLHPQMQARIAKAILALEHNPFPPGGKKLKNRDGFRIRVGGLSRALSGGCKVEADYHRRHPTPA